ncbi:MULTISPECIES: metallophosphoesterase [unclassified Helicobacter]|uniref:metallophosphoesterase n=1 Tax=unclassified Helicobacter TaxID=2593540 RepID=UPI0013153EB3|nr:MULTISPECIES: metallophosphoesterase [unclassified Helicobacter]
MILASLAILAVLILSICALYAPLRVVEYRLKLPSEQASSAPITIALLSDLHSGKMYQKEILAALRARMPDIIAMPGDMIDDKVAMRDAWEFFDSLDSHALKNIPRFYVSGNHEFWSGEIVHIKQRLREAGVIVLDSSAPKQNLAINGVNIEIWGVDDPYVYAYDEEGARKKEATKKHNKQWSERVIDRQWEAGIKSIFENALDFDKNADLADLDSGAKSGDLDSRAPLDSGENLDSAPKSSASPKAPFRILLSHRPEFVEIFRTLPVDLILSGHTHGGQVRLPFVNGLYAPNQGIFPKYAGGQYTLESASLDSSVSDSDILDSRARMQNARQKPQNMRQKTLIVSRGLSFNPVLPRIFNPPEIVFITLESI